MKTCEACCQPFEPATNRQVYCDLCRIDDPNDWIARDVRTTASLMNSPDGPEIKEALYRLMAAWTGSF